LAAAVAHGLNPGISDLDPNPRSLALLNEPRDEQCRMDVSAILIPRL